MFQNRFGVLLVTVTMSFAMAQPVPASDPCPKLKAGVFPENFFHPCRPEPIPAGERDLVLRTLPRAGEAPDLSRAERKKLAAVDSVLQMHERSGVYVVKVVEVATATTALHGRAVLIITHPALAVLSAEELQALVAHEIGHEYTWHQFAAARKRDDSARLRELELVSDMIAAETLRRLGVPANRLLSALDKIASYNRERFGNILNADAYPEMATRRSAIAAWRDSSPKAKP
jgi:Zn-dependent protease with chaperone function